MRRLLISFLIVSFFMVAISEAVPKDVSPEVPEYGMIVFLVNNGIMDLKNGKFSGSEYVSKYDVARYLYNLIKFMRTYDTMKADLGDVRSELRKMNELLGYDRNEMDFMRISSIEKRVKKLENMLYKMESDFDSTSASLDLKIDGVKEKMKIFKDIFDNFRSDTSKQFEDIRKMIGNILRVIDKIPGDLGERLDNLSKEIIDIKNMHKIDSKRRDELNKRVMELENQLNLFKDLIENSDASKSYIESIVKDISDLKNEVYSLKADMNLVKKALGKFSSVTEEATPKLLVITDTSFSVTGFSTSLIASTPASVDTDEIVKRVVKSLEDTLLSSDSSLSKTIDDLKKDLISVEGSLSNLRESFESSLSGLEGEFESSLTYVKENLSSSLVSLQSSVTELYEKMLDTKLSSEDIEKISNKVLPKLRAEFKEGLKEDLKKELGEEIAKENEKKFEEISRRIDDIDKKFTVQLAVVVVSFILGFLSIFLFFVE